jgi:hypothetical protein
MDATPDESLLAKIRHEATPAACRRFGTTLLGGLPAAGFVWVLILRFSTGQWIWAVEFGFCLAALVLGGGTLAFSALGRWVYIGWHVVVRAIELGLTWVLLFILFWLVITPVGFLRRRGTSGFQRGPAPGKKSYWQEVPPVKDPSRYYRQF